MKQYELIPIKPMRLRGVFGIAWNLYKRGFFGMFCYCLLFMGVFMLIGSFLNSGSMASLMKFGEGLDLGNNTFYHSFDGLAKGIGFSMLSFLLSLVNMLVLQPILQGGMYTEVSCHMYGLTGGFSGMIRRTGFVLKRFFGTQMTQWLASIGFGIGFFILYFIVLMIAFVSLIPSLLFSNGEPGIGMIIALVMVMLLLVLIFFAAMLFLSFLYPVAVNEEVYHFKALGRSFKLVAKRFWRVFGTNLLVLLILAVIIGILGVGYALLLNNGMDLTLSLMLYTLALVIVQAFFFPYQVSLSTALYYDARVRFPEDPKEQERPAAEEQPSAQGPIPEEPFEEGQEDRQ